MSSPRSMQRKSLLRFRSIREIFCNMERSAPAPPVLFPFSTEPEGLCGIPFESVCGSVLRWGAYRWNCRTVGDFWGRQHVGTHGNHSRSVCHNKNKFCTFCHPPAPCKEKAFCGSVAFVKFFVIWKDPLPRLPSCFPFPQSLKGFAQSLLNPFVAAC